MHIVVRQWGFVGGSRDSDDEESERPAKKAKKSGKGRKGRVRFRGRPHTTAQEVQVAQVAGEARSLPTQNRLSLAMGP